MGSTWCSRMIARLVVTYAEAGAFVLHQEAVGARAD